MDGPKGHDGNILLAGRGLGRQFGGGGGRRRPSAAAAAARGGAGKAICRARAARSLADIKYLRRRGLSYSADRMGYVVELAMCTTYYVKQQTVGPGRRVKQWQEEISHIHYIHPLLLSPACMRSPQSGSNSCSKCWDIWSIFGKGIRYELHDSSRARACLEYGRGGGPIIYHGTD